jgi:hypothetical protein
MDVENPATPPRDEIGRQDPHVSRQANEVGPRNFENARHGCLVFRPARVVRPLDGVSGKASIARQREAAGCGDVGHDGDDPRVGDAARVDCIRDRLEVGAAAGEQDREAPGARNLGFQASESTPAPTAALRTLDRIPSNNRGIGKESS